MVVDLAAASQAVARSVEKAERTSGLEITSALVSLAGSNVSSVNSRGVVGVSGRVIDQDDVARAVDAARAVAIPHNREIIHVIQRGFNVDGQDGIRMPLGMHGYRLEVETHIITAAAASVENLRQCVAVAGVDVSQFVLNPLASAEVVLNETERQMGVVVCRYGRRHDRYGDLYRWGCLAHGRAGGGRQPHHLGYRPRPAPAHVSGRGDQDPARACHPGRGRRRRNLSTSARLASRRWCRSAARSWSQIIEARVEEIFGLVVQEIKRSGYDGLLPAGMVLTGGSSALPGIRTVASQRAGCAGAHRPTRKSDRHDRQAGFAGIFDQRGLAALGDADERSSSRRAIDKRRSHLDPVRISRRWTSIGEESRAGSRGLLP